MRKLKTFCVGDDPERADGRFRRCVAAALLCSWIYTPQLSAQSVEQTYDVAGGLANPTFSLEVQPFDSLNGTRTLSGVQVGFAGSVDMEVQITNFTSLDLVDHEWYYDAGANLILAFDAKPGYADGGPFLGLGGIYESEITGVLSAGSGGPPPPFGSPTPGEVTVEAFFGDDFQSNVALQGSLAYFETDTPLQAQFSPFQDFVVTMPEDEPFGYIEARATSLDYQGTLTVTYDWVPTTGRPEDCNGDGVLDLADLTCACSAEPVVSLHDLLEALSLPLGDLDADSVVGFADFLQLSTNFGRNGNYREGDLNCDGVVAFGDFLVLAENFGQGQSFAHQVPEPHSYESLLWVLGLVCAGGRSFRSRTTPDGGLPRAISLP